MHINLTPTRNIGINNLLVNKNVKSKGLHCFRVKIIEDKKAQCTPGQYIVEDIKEVKRYFLNTNIFYYCFGKKGDVFEIKCELGIKNKDDAFLSMENWGDFKQYYMNIIPIKK
ncbi:MAG: hypothetical protein ACOYT4_00185 [Nanoarchaeota archaeon]